LAFNFWIMAIRLAQKENLPQINEIYNQAVRQRFCTAHLEPVELKEREKWFFAHVPSKFPVFVFVDNASVLGWVSLGPYREDRQALAHVAEVSYYVDRKVRGKGIGSRLLKHALEVAPDYGFSVLIAILLDKNPASIALLLKHAFKEWGRMPGIARIGSHEADHLYFGLKL
jgi:L-amino acid N-acyltransferase YncA